MIQGEGWYMIRELLREGLSVSEIARQIGRDGVIEFRYKTVSQMLEMTARDQRRLSLVQGPA